MPPKPEISDEPALTYEQWGGTVAWWNALGHHERQEVARVCANEGHQWRDLLLKGQQLCVQCCSYRPKDQP